MGEERKVSVVIPVYNAADTISCALRSVLNQTYGNMEVLVIDDCSTDRTMQILREYELLDSRIRVFSTDRNSGPGVTRSLGLKKVTGEFIAFLDADDFWLAEKIERQVARFDKDEVILCYTSIILLNSRRVVQGIVTARSKVGLKRMYLANWIGTSSAMFRSKLDGSTSMPALYARQDYAFWLTLLRRNPGYISGIAEPLVAYVDSPNSVSSNIFKVVHNYKMFTLEAGVHPLLAVVLVMFNVIFKVLKQVSAKVTWLFCYSSQERFLLQDDINKAGQ